MAGRSDELSVSWGNGNRTAGGAPQKQPVKKKRKKAEYSHY